MSYQGGAGQPEAFIAASTYSSMADPAIALHARIVERAEATDEVIDFSGAVGLDVGSADGGWGAVIGALGLDRVISIDPNSGLLEAGEVTGIIKPENAYAGSLQRWVAEGNEPAQSVFVFNMQRTLIASETFRRALRSATAIGGLLLPTFREREHMLEFSKHMKREDSGFRAIGRPAAGRKAHESTFSYAPERETYNTFIQFYRRVPVAGEA